MAPSDANSANGNGDRDICIAIDVGAINRRSLGLAVLLAERFKRGLRGVLLEHAYLQAVARLPFATEVSRSTGEERALRHDAIERENLRGRARVERLLAQSAQPRRVRYRLEVAVSDRIPVVTLLAERHDVFLPAAGPRRGEVDFASAERLETIKWVYDGSEQSARALDLIRQLVHSHQARALYLIATCAVPRSLLTELAAAGVRVYWVTVGSERGLFAQLASGPAVDLTLVPGSLVDSQAERQLAHLGRVALSPILIIA